MKKLNMKKKHILTVLFSIIFSAVGIANASPMITVNMTGNDQLGFASGQQYSFTFTLNENYVGPGHNSFSPTYSLWYIEQASQGQIILDISGSGLTGTYAQPAAHDYDTYEVFSNGPADNTLRVNAISDWGNSLGLTSPDGTSLKNIESFGLAADALSLSHPGSFVNIDDYLSDYTGTYTATDGSVNLRAVGSNDVFSFAVDSFTVGAIPEPATLGLVGLFSGGLLVVRRIFMI